jgi:hypothetical protein
MRVAAFAHHQLHRRLKSQSTSSHVPTPAKRNPAKISSADSGVVAFSVIDWCQPLYQKYSDALKTMMERTSLILRDTSSYIYEAQAVETFREGTLVVMGEVTPP